MTKITKLSFGAGVAVKTTIFVRSFSQGCAVNSDLEHRKRKVIYNFLVFSVRLPNLCLIYSSSSLSDYWPSLGGGPKTSMEKQMKLFNLKKDESGAVTVDWVVLTAALVLIGGVVITIVDNGLDQAASNIRTDLINS
ncbi:MAG: hypothetical protein AAF826_00185 [Pseudomonadota bacterium]